MSASMGRRWQQRRWGWGEYVRGALGHKYTRAARITSMCAFSGWGWRGSAGNHDNTRYATGGGKRGWGAKNNGKEQGMGLLGLRRGGEGEVQPRTQGLKRSKKNKDPHSLGRAVWLVLAEANIVVISRWRGGGVGLSGSHRALWARASLSYTEEKGSEGDSVGGMRPGH